MLQCLELAGVRTTFWLFFHSVDSKIKDPCRPNAMHTRRRNNCRVTVRPTLENPVAIMTAGNSPFN